MQKYIISAIIVFAALGGTLQAQEGNTPRNIEKNVRILFVDEEGNSLRNLYVEHRYRAYTSTKQMENSEKVGSWFLLSPDYYAESARQEDGMFHLTLPVWSQYAGIVYHTLAARTNDRSLGGYFILPKEPDDEPIRFTLVPYHKVSMKFISAVDGEPLRNTTLSGLFLHRLHPTPASSWSSAGWYRDHRLKTNGDGVVTFDCLPGRMELKCETQPLSARPSDIWTINSGTGRPTSLISIANGVVKSDNDLVEGKWTSQVAPLYVWHLKPEAKDTVIDIGTIAFYGKGSEQWQRSGVAVVLDENGHDPWYVDVKYRYYEANREVGSLGVRFEEAFEKAKQNGRNVLFVPRGNSHEDFTDYFYGLRLFLSPFEFVALHAPVGIGRDSRTFEILKEMTGQEVDSAVHMIAFSADGEFLGALNYQSRDESRQQFHERRRQFLAEHAPPVP